MAWKIGDKGWLHQEEWSYYFKRYMNRNYPVIIVSRRDDKVLVRSARWGRRKFRGGSVSYRGVKTDLHEYYAFEVHDQPKKYIRPL